MTRCEEGDDTCNVSCTSHLDITDSLQSFPSKLRFGRGLREMLGLVPAFAALEAWCRCGAFLQTSTPSGKDCGLSRLDSLSDRPQARLTASSIITLSLGQANCTYGTCSTYTGIAFYDGIHTCLDGSIPFSGCDASFIFTPPQEGDLINLASHPLNGLRTVTSINTPVKQHND